MLLQLYIKDLVLVTELTVEFSSGLSVLTGETGAGKSILFEAMGLALGERADTQMIRTGANQAEVSAVFHLAGLPEALAWLLEQALDAGHECALRRLLSRDGRSRAYINGRPVALRQLQALGEKLVIVHAQNSHQALLQREAQQTLFDRRNALEAQALRVSQTWRHWRESLAALTALRDAELQRAQQHDWLAFQVQTLAQLDPQPGEYTRLQEEFARLSHLQELLAVCTQAQEDIYERETFNAYRALGQTRSRLQQAQRYAPELAEVVTLLEDAALAVQEASLQLRGLLRTLETDPVREAWLAERLATWQATARKHQAPPDTLPGLRAALEQQLVAQNDSTLVALERATQLAARAHQEATAHLSQCRREALLPFVRRVNAEMQALGLGQARFDVSLQALPESGPSGGERIEFLLSANPGQTLTPLAKTASGGEFTRVSLAIQTAAVATAKGPTLVFDEIDVGVGGKVAELVGRKLRNLAEGERQVLCVTHQAQVAVLGQQHYKVSKTLPPHSETLLQQLTEAERAEEIARMLGGVEITAQTRAHAHELLSRANARR